jgi:hypothetical protein
MKDIIEKFENIYKNMGAEDEVKVTLDIREVVDIICCLTTMETWEDMMNKKLMDVVDKPNHITIK